MYQLVCPVPMIKKLIKWIVQFTLTIIGIVGAHDLTDATRAWVKILADNPWVAVILIFTGGVASTLSVQDIWSSRLPHRIVDWLADCFWIVRQLFFGSIQSGYIRAYYVPKWSEDEPPDPLHITNRIGVRFKRPWRSTLPSGDDAAGEFWVASTFVTVYDDNFHNVLPPSKTKVWGLIFGGRDNSHVERRPNDKYIRYRLPPDGRLSPLIHLGHPPAMEWKELCYFNVSPHDENLRVIPLETIDLDAVNEILVTIDVGNDGMGNVLQPPGAVFSRINDLQIVPADEQEPDKDRMLYCHLSDSGSSAAIGNTRNVLPVYPFNVKFGIAFRQAADSTKNAVTDTLLFYCPEKSRVFYAWLSIDWR